MSNDAVVKLWKAILAKGRKQRPCLKCRKLFKSDSAGHRKCVKCRRSERQSEAWLIEREGQLDDRWAP
jgi:tRNA(Ile2) C34 agmatinyltransferase TiaS